MSNPLFNHAGRPAYELPELMKAISSVDRSKPLDETARNTVEAASAHADNAKEYLLEGIETIGSMLVQMTQLSDPIDQRTMMGIGGLIRYIAVELQYLADVQCETDIILKRDLQAKKGGAK